MFEKLKNIDITNIDQLMSLLKLPRERAERTAELAQQLQDGEIDPVGFYELAANFMLRKEQRYNDAVTRYGIKPFFGLAHLHPEAGESGPSVNQILRNTFDHINSKDDVIAASEQAQEAGVIYLSKNLVMFHANDVNVTDDGFEIDPELAGETDDAPADNNEQENEQQIDASAAVGL